MAYVNYTVAEPKPMGPPSVGGLGAAPQLRRDPPQIVTYTRGMTQAQKALFSGCITERRKHGHLVKSDWEACRAEALRGKKSTVTTRSARTAVSRARTATAAAPPSGVWKIWAVGGAVILGAAWLFKRKS